MSVNNIKENVEHLPVDGAANQEAADTLYGKEGIDTIASSTEEKAGAKEDTPSNEPVEEVKEEGAKDPGAEQSKEGEEVKEVEYKLELPKETYLDQAAMDNVVAFAKEQKLSNEQAQSILNREHEAISKYQVSQQEAYDAQLNAWRSEVVNDKVMGGDNLKRTSENARRVVERFGNPEFITILNDTGYGDNPEVVRFLSKIGAIMSEDSLIMPGSKAESAKSTEELFYGSN